MFEEVGLLGFEYKDLLEDGIVDLNGESSSALFFVSSSL